MSERADITRRTNAGYIIYSEKHPGKRLSKPLPSKAAAEKRLGQIEFFKAKAARHDARPRLPHQIPPTRIEQDYAAALIRMIGRLRAAYAPLLRELPSILDDAAAERGDQRADAAARLDTARLDTASGRAKKLLAQARAAPVIDTSALEQLAGKYAKATSDHQKEQLRRQAHAAIKVDPVFRDADLAPLARHFVHENVALIKRIPRRLHDDVEAMVHGAVSRGHRHKHLERQIQERFHVAEKHARLIARDQIGKFHAKANHHRQRELGVRKFVWRTVGDERVRPWHQELDDTTHAYDKPPRNPDTGERVLPGEDIQCRCSAEPVFP